MQIFIKLDNLEKTEVILSSRDCDISTKNSSYHGAGKGSYAQFNVTNKLTNNIERLNDNKYVLINLLRMLLSLTSTFERMYYQNPQTSVNFRQLLWIWASHLFLDVDDMAERKRVVPNKFSYPISFQTHVKW